MLLNSEPHPDHGAGLTVLQQASGQLWASDASADPPRRRPDAVLPLRALLWIGAPVIRRGRPRFKDWRHDPCGPIALTAHVTVGHTRGCVVRSVVRDGGRVNVVRVTSELNLEECRTRGDRERSIAVRGLPAEIWVTCHDDGGEPKSSRALPRRTRWTRSSTLRAPRLIDAAERNYTKSGCTSSTALRCGGTIFLVPVRGFEPRSRG